MKSNEQLYKERLDRLNKAIALEKTDRTPVVFFGDSFCARHMGYTIAQFCTSVKESSRIILESIKALNQDFDCAEVTFGIARTFPLTMMEGVKIPGVDLGEDMLWQIDEKELMTVEDYDTILDKGWDAFAQDYLVNRIKFDFASFGQDMAYVPQSVMNFAAEGIPAYAGVVENTANERLAGGRSMAKFMRDLYKMPDKVEAVLDLVQKSVDDNIVKQIKAADASIAFLSPARGASEFFSPKLWERFVWKCIKSTADAVIDAGAKINIHVDSNWERDLDYFKEFPRGKVIFETDGSTDIYKIKEKLGGIMCIKGDVPSGKLALATPDEVYDYSKRLINDMGTGFILSSGCSIPPNAKPENVKAMLSAVK